MTKANRFDRGNLDHQVRQYAVAAKIEPTYGDIERICKEYGAKFSREARQELYESAIAAYRQTHDTPVLPIGKDATPKEPRLMQANTRGELHDHVHYERESCKSNPPCQPVPVTDVIFRVWRKKDHDPIAIFPAVPGDARGRYCQMYEHVGQHSGGDYLNVVRQTRLAKPAEYAALKKELESEPYNYVLRVCQRQTKKHRREFALTLKAWLTRNQDSSVTSTLAEGSDTKPPKLPKTGDLFRYEEQERTIAEITSLYHIPSIRFEANGQNQYVAIDALEWDGGMEWWYKKPLKDDNADVIVSEALDSTINTAAMEERIAAAARKALYIPNGPLQTTFEHGHWWVSNADTGEQWSVEDASGPGSTDGFDFEKVKDADDDGADNPHAG